MKIHDQLFVIAFIILMSVTATGGLYLSRRIFSNLLLTIIFVCLLVMGVFHIYFLSTEGLMPIHTIILSLAQFAVLGLAFKLWLSLNYHEFSHPIRVLFHVVSHSAFISVVLMGYWSDKEHPLLVFLLYPFAGLSISLVGESIEEAIERGYNADDKK